MSIATITLIVLGIVVAALALVFGNDIYEDRRRKRRQGFGLKNGFETFPDDAAMGAQFQFPRTIELYDDDAPRFENPLKARRGGADLLLVDYTFNEWVGDRTFTRDFTVCHFRCAELDLPAFAMREASLGDKAATLVGFQDIDLSDAPVFSSKFLLRGKDEAAIRRLFTPSVTRCLEAATNIQVQGHDDVLIVTRSGGFVPEPELPALLRQAEKIFNVLRS